jgi:hypothetical protein
VAADDVVQQVAELVEQRPDVVVLHQPAGTGQVAEQRALGESSSRLTGDHPVLRRVLVLVLTGMEVEVDPPERLPGARSERLPAMTS